MREECSEADARVRRLEHTPGPKASHTEVEAYGYRVRVRPPIKRCMGTSESCAELEDAMAPASWEPKSGPSLENWRSVGQIEMGRTWTAYRARTASAAVAWNGCETGI